MIRNLTRLWRREDGAIAVEAALSIGALMFLVLGIFEFGLLFYQWNTMMLAVEQAGRYVMINNSSCNTATCAETQMQNVLTGATVCTTPSAGKTCVSATLTTNTAPTPSTMQLTATYGINLFMLGSFTLKSQGTVPLD